MGLSEAGAETIGASICREKSGIGRDRTRMGSPRRERARKARPGLEPGPGAETRTRDPTRIPSPFRGSTRGQNKGSRRTPEPEPQPEPARVPSHAPVRARVGTHALARNRFRTPGPSVASAQIVSPSLETCLIAGRTLCPQADSSDRKSGPLVASASSFSQAGPRAVRSKNDRLPRAARVDRGPELTDRGRVILFRLARTKFGRVWTSLGESWARGRPGAAPSPAA